MLLARFAVSHTTSHYRLLHVDDTTDTTGSQSMPAPTAPQVYTRLSSTLLRVLRPGRVPGLRRRPRLGLSASRLEVPRVLRARVGSSHSRHRRCVHTRASPRITGRAETQKPNTRAINPPEGEPARTAPPPPAGDQLYHPCRTITTSTTMRTPPAALRALSKPCVR
eukprot:scaffold27242_cov70-Phaeocystis_antarctica.AAC.5